jgi:hypothetical protein
MPESQPCREGGDDMTHDLNWTRIPAAVLTLGALAVLLYTLGAPIWHSG